MRKKEIIGSALVIIGVAGMYLSTRDALPKIQYFTAIRDFNAGEVVAASDFRAVAIDLRTAGNHYITANARFSAHRVLRKISRGELIPRDAISSQTTPERRKEISLTLPNNKSPIGLKRGDLVDIYFFEVPTEGEIEKSVQQLRIFQQIQIHSIEKEQSQFNGDININILLNPEDVSDFLTLLLGNEFWLSKGSEDAL
jgi:hypothetical protein